MSDEGNSGKLAAPLSWLAFYAECLKYATTGAWGVIGDLSTGLPIAILVFRKIAPHLYSVVAAYLKAHGIGDDWLLIAPLSVGALILLGRVITAPYVLYRDKPAPEATREGRELTLPQRQIITATIVQLIPNAKERAARKVSVLAIGAERETRAYSHDFAETLRVAGLSVDSDFEANFEIPFTRNYLQGVHIRRTDASEPSTDLVLGSALRAARILFKAIPDPENETGVPAQPKLLAEDANPSGAKMAYLYLGKFKPPVQLLVGEP